MRNPKSTGSGSTHVWKNLSDKFNKLGNKDAEEVRDRNKGNVKNNKKEEDKKK
jgi:hypothetical protein